MPASASWCAFVISPAPAALPPATAARSAGLVWSACCDTMGLSSSKRDILKTADGSAVYVADADADADAVAAAVAAMARLRLRGALVSRAWGLHHAPQRSRTW